MSILAETSLQNRGFAIKLVFHDSFNKIMKNQALACMAAPKCTFRLSQKLVYFQASNIEKGALMHTRSSFWQYFYSAKIAAFFSSTFGKVRGACTTRIFFVSETSKRSQNAQAVTPRSDKNSRVWLHLGCQDQSNSKTGPNSFKIHQNRCSKSNKMEQ